jgi:hypothetical protein
MVEKDRRMFPRKRVNLRLEGRSNCGLVDGTSRGRLTLKVDDLSLGGLCATVDQPLVRGSRLAVFFPPVQDCAGAMAGGRVVGCARSDNAYRIRVQFDLFPSSRGRLPCPFPSRMLSLV